MVKETFGLFSIFACFAGLINENVQKSENYRFFGFVNWCFRCLKPYWFC